MTAAIAQLPSLYIVNVLYPDERNLKEASPYHFDDLGARVGDAVNKSSTMTDLGGGHAYDMNSGSSSEEEDSMDVSTRASG
jgi:hypothetical protein